MPKISFDHVKRYLLPTLVLIPLAYLLAREVLFHLKSDRDKIAYCINTIVASANQRQVGSLLDQVSDDYHDRFHSNKDALRKTLQGMWFRYRKVAVCLQENPKITINPKHPNEASVVFSASVKLSATPNGPGSDVLLRMRGTDKFYLKLKKVGGGWKVISCAGKAE